MKCPHFIFRLKDDFMIVPNFLGITHYIFDILYNLFLYCNYIFFVNISKGNMFHYFIKAVKQIEKTCIDGNKYLYVDSLNITKLLLCVFIVYDSFSIVVVFLSFGFYKGL